MKQLNTEQNLYSPSDLIAFLECSHKSYLNFKSLSGEIQRSKPSGLLEMFRQKGLKHETKYLQNLKLQNPTVAEIPTEVGMPERTKLTIDAMHAGADVIYQATLYNPPWQGIADFLIKCNKASSLGNYSYEVLETKLSRTASVRHIMQLCAYSELVANIQGIQPINMYLLLGNDEKVRFRLNDFYFYYTHTKKCFENYMAHITKIDSYPEPCRHCPSCEWKTVCTTQWQKDEHLILIANIQRKQIEKLREKNITTIGELVASSPDTQIPDLPTSTFRRLHTQATLQDYKARTGKDRYEIIQPAKDKGFALMPMPDQADLFFDIEGDPFYPDGLAYLFGIYSIENGKENFKTFWGHNHEQEKENFKHFMDFLNRYLTKHPDANVYHYGFYEKTLLKRLSDRYAIHEKLLMKLTQTQRFIDLYEIVHNSIYISEPNYSLKNFEKFHMEQRTDVITQALDSVAVYSKWCENQDPILLQQIADYNKMDCRSTYLLREWLIRIKPKEIPWRKKIMKEIRRANWEIEYENYKNQLVEQQEKAPPLHQRLVRLLEFHNRETKPEQLNGTNPHNDFEYDSTDDPDCLAELQQVGEPKTENHKLIYSYRFPSQECTLNIGQKIVDTETMDAIGEIYKLDKNGCVIDIKINGIKKTPPEQLSICASNSVNSNIIRSAIYRYANHLINTPEVSHVATELLTRNLPRIEGKRLDQCIDTSDDLVNTTLKTISSLDHSYLFIQGPPGSGKTYLCSRIIVDLIKQRKKIGISANSHHAIHHLLKKVEDTAMQQNIYFKGIKKATAGNDRSFYDRNTIRNVTSFEEIDFDAKLYAGTAWVFSSPYFDKQLDYLFIDEAGQVSTANIIAMSNATQNIILLGDHMQLSQPMRGIHPQESGLSILKFLLGDNRVISADRGIFLNRTYRLRPSICQFISDTFYEGRLIPHEETSFRKLDLQDADLPDEGIVIINTHHEKCSIQSVEEAKIIKQLYQKLLGKNLTEKDDTTRPITTDDILIVTPYNSQADYLYTLLPENARIGTVDKFQGQEAPIVLVSMVSSCVGHFSQKIIEFLYSDNRLNVALSRAQCLAIVVASPKLMEVSCTTVEQMKLVNTYCRLNRYAKTLSSTI